MAQRSLLNFVFFQTPLHLAAANGKRDVVEILLRNGANIHEKDVRNEMIVIGWEEIMCVREKIRERATKVN